MPSVPSTQLKPLTWEWVSAFFDGEGCIVVRRDKRRHSVDIWLQFHQHNRTAVLMEIREFLEARGIVVYYRDAGEKSALQIYRKQDVELCLRRMLPYIRVKRVQMNECYTYMKELKKLQNEFGQKYWLWTGSRLESPRTAKVVNFNA